MGMQLIDKIPHFSKAVEGVKSTDELDSVVMSYFKDLGVKMYSYRHLPPVGAIDYSKNPIVSFFGFPPSWMNFYRDSEFCIHDPVLIPAIEQNRAFSWKELLKFCEKTEKIKKYISQVNNLNINDGLAFPVSGAHFRGGVFLLGFETDCAELTELEVSLLHWSTQMVHNQYITLLGNRLGEAINLTQREHEILKYMALGKSNCEIGVVLGISKNTINTYVRQIFLKLDVCERVSASLRAVSLGLV